MKTLKIKESKWNLKKLYTNDINWEKSFNKLVNLVKKTNNFKGTIHTANDVLNILSLQQKIDHLDMKLYTYAFLKSELNKKNAKYKAMLSKSVNYSSIATVELSWVVKEISTIPSWKLKKIMNLKKLHKFKERLDNILKTKNQTSISTKEERVITMATGVFNSFNDIRTDIELNNIKFPKIVTSGGKKLRINHNNIPVYNKHPDRSIRKQIYTNKNKAYLKNSNSFAGLLKGHIQSNIIESKTYNNDSVIDFLLSNDNIEHEYIQNFLCEVKKKKSIFNKYFNLKRKHLKLPSLKYYDVLAKNDNVKKVSYSDAVEIFLNSIKSLGSSYEKTAIKAFKDNWVDSVDSLEKKNPSNLGFSFNPYITHPHVFISYKGDLESITTLSHEIGHAIHGFNMNKNNSFYDVNISFILHEAIAYTNEILTLNHLINHSKSKVLQEQAMWHLRDMFYINIMLKSIETDFELSAYDLVKNNKKWNGEILCKNYLKIQKKYLGNSIDLKESKGVEWTFGDINFTNFYNTKYLIAFCLAVNIAERIMYNDTNFIKQYTELLKAGDTKSLNESLKKLDIDLLNIPDLVNQTLLKFESIL